MVVGEVRLVLPTLRVERRARAECDVTDARQDLGAVEARPAEVLDDLVVDVASRRASGTSSIFSILVIRVIAVLVLSPTVTLKCHSFPA